MTQMLARLVVIGLGLTPPFLAAAGGESGSKPRVLEAGGLPAEAAALLMSAEHGGLLAMEVLALPRAVHADGGVDFEVTVQVRGSDVMEGQAEKALLEIFAYALDKDNVVRDSLLKIIEIDAEEPLRRLASSGLKYTGRLTLPPGKHSLRLLARNPASSVVGLRRLELDVPSPGGGEPRLFPPIFEEPAEAWLSAVEESRVEPDAAREPAAQLLPESAVAPWPVLAGEPVRVYRVVGHGLREKIALTLEIHPLLEDGGWGEPLLLEVPVARRREPAPGWSVLESSISPVALEPGNYRVRLAETAPDPTRSPDIPLFRLPETALEEAPVWASLGRPKRAVAATPAAQGRHNVARLGVPRTQLRRELRRALVELTEAGTASALAVLTATQAKALRGSGTAVELLREAEIVFARSLHRRDPESLAAVTDLYLAAYANRREAGDPLLTSHNRLLVTELAELEVRSAGSAGSESARRHAADTLTRLATGSGKLLTAMSEALYRRALELEPTHEAALLSLVTGYERRADYSTATSVLRDFLELRPEHREARLRLAVNLSRSRETRAARRLFAEVASSGPADWIRAVAYQELAAGYLDRGEIVSVEELLDEARAVLPEDEKLRLLQAFILDTKHEPRRAGKLLEHEPTTRESARYVYSQGLSEVLRRVAGEAPPIEPARLAALRKALAASS